MKINQEKIVKAWLFASRVHKEQKYPGEQLPYIAYIGNVLLDVMGVASTLKTPELAIICAILHDSIEDTPIAMMISKKSLGRLLQMV
jgi:(p)ppGpp synthase/HD superfamily hydrolase